MGSTRSVSKTMLTPKQWNYGTIKYVTNPEFRKYLDDRLLSSGVRVFVARVSKDQWAIARTENNKTLLDGDFHFLSLDQMRMSVSIHKESPPKNVCTALTKQVMFQHTGD